MIAITSKSAGVLLLPKPGTSEYTVLDLVGGEEQDPVEAQYLYSAVQDWEEIEYTDTNTLLRIATDEYWLDRTVSLLCLAIGGLDEPLEREILEHVEELLSSRVSSEKALNRLLVAPLLDCGSLQKLIKTALYKGFSAIASLLEEMNDLQPLLRRLTDHWLALEDSFFARFSESRERIWATVVGGNIISKLLKANSKGDFVPVWNSLVFLFTTPESRLGVTCIGRELSQRLFPHEKQEEIMTEPLTKETEAASRVQIESGMKAQDALDRVEKQINAIAQAVSEGRDAKAEKFLRELIQEQISFSGGESYVVKSLCNIAQRCADMFRMDFEVFCLDEARQLVPFDTWTLIQYGDHLKRVGKYDDAIISFNKAERLGESDVAKSCVADVYSQRSDYARAIHIYEAIPNFHNKPKVLTAIADNLRKMGRMEDSEAAYMGLIDRAKQGFPEFSGSEVRAQVGIAEIEKTQGKLKDSLRKYRRILEREGIDNRDRLIYKLGMCNVLKLMESFSKAYSIVDEIIQEYPFSMKARFIRGSILGLIGRELDGLDDLPERRGSRSWREWLRPYYRGLLLFKLKRYEDAKKNLVEELSRALASGEEKAILRMAAALCFLRDDETSAADGILSEIPDLDNCHAQYLSLVFKMHSAAQREDLTTMNSLRERIAKLQVTDERLAKAVVALDERNFSLAVAYETDALLKLAA